MDLLDPPLIWPQLIWPIVSACAAGAVIGLEREYRASPAGFRTHILVCLSSTLLMLAAVHQVRWLTDTPVDVIRIDPARMAHGVLTGIGFLCGGVIFREGFSVRGLTTAASLWMTSALGILFGVGFLGLALVGSVATLAVLAAVSFSERVLPRRHYADVKVRFRRDAQVSRAGFRALLAEHRLKPLGVSETVGDQVIEFAATVDGSGEARIDALAEALRRRPDVAGFECLPHQA